MNRRDFVKLTAAAGGGFALLQSARSTSAAVGSAKMKLALSEISTVNAPFKEDLRAYKGAGFDAIGIWEMKLPNDDSVGDALHASGLAVANCVPAVPSILPWNLKGMEGPRDPKERIDKICASMERLAKYKPTAVLVISGPLGKFGPDKGREIVIDGLRQAMKAARAAGLRLGLEPIHPMQHDTTSFVNTITDAMEILKDTGENDLGIHADTYNMWNEKPADLAAIAARVTGLHVADVPKEPGRSDRVLPLEGGTKTFELVSALLKTGWTGILDVEIFSTPERFWGLPIDEAARRAKAADAALRDKLA
jgi:sugar phosphate isomerase/epimerase